MKLTNSAICSLGIALSMVAGCLVVPSVAVADLRVDDRVESRVDRREDRRDRAVDRVEDRGERRNKRF